MNNIKHFKLELEIITHIDLLDSDDAEDWGHNQHHVIDFNAFNEEMVLDMFHHNFPISNLEHFNIRVTEIEGK